MLVDGRAEIVDARAISDAFCRDAAAALLAVGEGPKGLQPARVRMVCARGGGQSAATASAPARAAAAGVARGFTHCRRPVPHGHRVQPDCGQSVHRPALTQAVGEDADDGLVVWPRERRLLAVDGASCSKRSQQRALTATSRPDTEQRAEGREYLEGLAQPRCVVRCPPAGAEVAAEAAHARLAVVAVPSWQRLVVHVGRVLLVERGAHRGGRGTGGHDLQAVLIIVWVPPLLFFSWCLGQ